jgi:hypothetical protein
MRGDHDTPSNRQQSLRNPIIDDPIPMVDFLVRFLFVPGASCVKGYVPI